MKLIIFDLDGTLYDTATSFIPAIKMFLNKYGIDVPSDEELYSFIGEPELVFVEWIKSLQIESTNEDLIAEFDRLEREAIISDGKLYDVVGEMLNELNLAGYRFGLCSNGPQWYIELILKKLDIGRFFDIVRFPETEIDNKPEMVAEIVDRLKPEKVFMVGDRVHDLTAAKANNLAFVGVSYGFGREEISRADHLVNSVPELKELLKELI